MNTNFARLPVPGLCLLLAAALPLAAQEPPPAPPVPAAPEVALKAVSGRLAPKLPARGRNLIMVEGEDAVSTNFNREPILNYSCSGFRALQLNQKEALQEGSSYYADYVFYVEEDGLYELWYGGTPPGNKSELMVSYTSPFRYTLDDVTTVEVHREDVTVVDLYAPAYYWNMVKETPLNAGSHRIRFEVTQKRSYDGRFFLYLDAFFLVRKEKGEYSFDERRPAVFPADMKKRSLNNPFSAVEDFAIRIREHPENVGLYVELSLIYSLVGDYLNAIKYLRKAVLLEPDNPQVHLLLAKNSLWKGDVYEGLAMYEDLLRLEPERLDFWTEAGKVAAWVGKYDESERFFQGGLKIAPENLSLLVNLGFTYQWAGRRNKAFEQFETARALAEKRAAGGPGMDVAGYKELARIFEVNGYVSEAPRLYLQALNLKPDDLELYFLLSEAYVRLGKPDKADAIEKLIDERFEQSPDFLKVVEVFKEKRRMKDRVVEKLEDQLGREPDNLVLRKTLAEIYFWNGNRRKSIEEYLRILTTYAFKSFGETEKSALEFLESIDRGYALAHYLSGLPGYINASLKGMNESMTRLNAAKSELASIQKNQADKGESDPAAVEAARKRVADEENKFASLVVAKESFIEKFKGLQKRFAQEKTVVDRLVSEDKTRQDTFEQVLKSTEWKWDQPAVAAELRRVERDGLDLAGYLLARIDQFSGRPDQASARLAGLADKKAAVPGLGYALLQQSIWSGDAAAALELYGREEAELVNRAPYLPQMIDYLRFLNAQDEEMIGFLTRDPVESIKDLTERFRVLAGDAAGLRQEAARQTEQLHELLGRRMAQGFFRLTESTYQLRNELGDFLQAEKRYTEASLQYLQVLAIEPWNIAAKYKLGQVYQGSGDWSKAQQYYQAVYREDPLYSNVQSFYNQLAREHAEQLSASTSMISDTSKLEYAVNISFSKPVNGLYSLELDYQLDNYRIYRVFLPRDAASLVQHRLTLGVPLRLAGFTVKPFAGLAAWTDLSDSSSAAALSGNPGPGELIGRYNAHPHGGGEVEYKLGPVLLGGRYRFDFERESLLPGRKNSYFHEGQARASSDFAFTELPVLEGLKLNTQASAQLHDAGGLVYGGGLDGWLTFHLLPSQALDLSLITSARYDDTSDYSVEDYWVPRGVLSVLGGLGLAGSFGNSDSLQIAAGIQLTGGFYADKAKDAGGNWTDQQSLTFNLESQVELQTPRAACYMKIIGNLKNKMSPVQTPADYWSLTAELGVRAPLPDLLAE